MILISKSKEKTGFKTCQGVYKQLRASAAPDRTQIQFKKAFTIEKSENELNLNERKLSDRV